jgi:crotonobetainyl-CoA:carnitine CoA-transferase CaiB-like acyl-CoA transferase
VIAVSGDAQWHALSRALDRPDWLEDQRFSDGLRRWQYRADLNRLLAEATKGWDAHRLMQELQAVGIAAGAVLDSKDLLFDPHLRKRGFFEVVSHHPSTGIPPLPYAGRPWKLLGTPHMAGRAAPIMGEHNRLVLHELLGRSEGELAALEAQGVIGYAPVDPRPVQRPSLDEQVRQGRMQRYETDFREQVARAYNQPHAL